MKNEGLPLRRENFKKLHQQHNIWRWAFSTFLAALFMFFVCFVWFDWVKIGNDSMAPTLHEGDLVLVNRLHKYYREIERTDLVAFYKSGTREMMIKRVVATGGESVNGQSNSVWIDEKYRLLEDEYGAANTEDFDTVEVPEGYVYVLSDDRRYMGDSRDEEIGCIPLDDIIGVVSIRLLPSFIIYR